MTAKEYLMQYRDATELMRQTDARILDIRAELTGLDVGKIRSPWPDGQPHGSGKTDPTGTEAIADADRMTEKHREELRQLLEDLKVKAQRERVTLWEKRDEVEETIKEVPDPTLKEVLHRRYISGEHFELIAVELSYSYRHIIRLHYDALLEVEKILKKRSCP